MNTKLKLLLAAPLVLGCSVAWSQDAEDASPELPEQAAEQARDAAQLPDAAANGLAVAAEATIRLMDDDDDEVTNDLELPMLPERGAAGQRGQDVAAKARAGRENFGRERAEEARNNAREAAEGRGRAEDLPDNVPGRPDNPGRPDDPGRPDNPGNPNS